jgi:hypothetical protein
MSLASVSAGNDILEAVLSNWADPIGTRQRIEYLFEFLDNLLIKSSETDTSLKSIISRFGNCFKYVARVCRKSVTCSLVTVLFEQAEPQKMP